MTEKLLQFIWKNRYFNQQGLELMTGEPLMIEYPGEENTHQGPDFINARIRINGNYWIGQRGTCIYFLPDGLSIVIRMMKITVTSYYMWFGNRTGWKSREIFLNWSFAAGFPGLCWKHISLDAETRFYSL